MDNRQFIAVFQGMCLCGANIFHRDFLNLFLNQYIKRVQGSADGQALVTSEVFQFLEILIVYLKANRSVMNQIRSQQLIKLSAEFHLLKACPQMSFNQIGSVYWLAAHLDDQWTDSQLLQQLE